MKRQGFSIHGQEMYCFVRGSFPESGLSIIYNANSAKHVGAINRLRDQRLEQGIIIHIYIYICIYIYIYTSGPCAQDHTLRTP